MKFNGFFLCNSFLDLADVTHSLTLSDHISIFNSNNCCTKTTGQIFCCRFNRFAERNLPGILCICSKLPEVHRAELNVTYSCFHSRVQGQQRKKGKYTDADLLEISWRCGENFSPRCLGGILESRFAQKADMLP